ncbi:hypothetical protein ACTXGQ_02325 [Marinobacter sp. 1Y8]
MKSQDILLLLKLVSFRRDEIHFMSRVPPRLDYLRSNWQGWDDGEDDDSLLEGDLGVSLDADLSVVDVGDELAARRYSVRALSASTGIGKTEVNNSLKRSHEVGLLRLDRKSGLLRTNTKALIDIIVYAARYVFPIHLGPVTRGIPTAYAAPILASELSSTGELVPVWPDPYGKTKGQGVQPLYKSAPHAVRRDPFLYSLLALTDAIRLGGARETALAIEQLRKETDTL